MPANQLPAIAKPRPRWAALAGVAITGTSAGGVFGLLTNAVNGAVSPHYFVAVLRWHNVADIWRASIAQGLIEGLILGLALSVVFCTGVGIITSMQCPYWRAAKYLLGVIAATGICWLLGGTLAMGLATLSPDFYRNAFIDVPEDFHEMLRYAWVGGSIVGSQLGAIVNVALALGILSNPANRPTHRGDETFPN